MHVYHPILTQHRVRRLVLWALAMLQWIAAIVFAERPVSFRHMEQRADSICLSALTRLVANLIVARALQMLRRRRRRVCYWHRGRDARRAHFFRSLLGSKLRRALNHKVVATRIAQLIGVLRNLDTYAAHLAKRLRRKLTRYFRLTQPPIAQVQALLRLPAGAPVCADTS